MTRSTLLATILALATLVSSFVSQQVIAYYFGASRVTDAYFVAITLPMLLVNLVGLVASMTLIPIFVEVRVRCGDRKAWELASSVTVIVLTVLTGLVLVGEAAARPLLRVGWPELASGDDTVVELFRWSGPIVILLGWSGIVAGVHQANGRFLLSTGSAMLVPLGMIAGTLLAQGVVGVRSLVFGQLLGALAQAVVLGFGILGSEKLWFRWRPKAEGLAKASWMMLPLLLGGVLYLSVPAVERFFAARLSPGSVSYLALAGRIGNVLGPLLVSGLSVTLLPRLSDDVARGRSREALETLSLSIRAFIIAAVPIIVFSPLYSTPLIRFFFEKGMFHEADSLAVAKVLPYYAVAMTAAAYGTLISRGFFAFFADALTPALNAGAHVVLYVVAAAVFVEVIGVTGLAAAQALFWCSTVVVASFVFARRVGIMGRRSLAVAVRCVLSALLVYLLSARAIKPGTSPPLAFLGLAGSAACYLILTTAVFRVREVSLVLNSIRGSWPSTADSHARR